MAPGAAIEIYQGPNNSSGPIDVYQQIADDDTASIVSTSWGTCESDPSGDPAAEQPIFEQMAARVRPSCRRPVTRILGLQRHHEQQPRRR